MMEPNAKEYTLETASRGPLTLSIRSGLPGMLSETITRAPLFSRISLTWEPPLPMIMEASWVTIRHRIWMLAVGAGGEVAEDGSPEVVAASLPSLALSSFLASAPFEVGVDEVVSPPWMVPVCDASIIVTSDAWGTLLADGPSRAYAPVLARLWFFFCSESDGERDLLRVDSSGMVVI